MKHIYKIFVALLAAAAFAACQKNVVTAPAPVEYLTAYPGIEFCKLTFVAPAEADSFKVFYGSGKYYKYAIDKEAEVQEIEVSPLPAGEYILRVVVLDKAGINSDPKGVEVKVRDKNDFAKDIWEVEAATASDNSYLIDDDVETIWVAESNTQSINIDIKDAKALTFIAINSTKEDGGSYITKLSLEVSEDGSVYSKAVESDVNADGFLHEISFPEVKGRFLKLNILGASSANPVKISELDFGNTVARSGQNGIVKGGLVNNKIPFDYDKNLDISPTLSPRMSQCTSWIHEHPSQTLVSHDTAMDALCIFVGSGWEVPDVVNGKVYQAIGLDAGKYRFTMKCQWSNRPFYDIFFVAAEGKGLPDITDLQAGTATVCGSYRLNGASTYGINYEFIVSKVGVVSVGYVYNATTPGDQWPWCELYMSELTVEKID